MIESPEEKYVEHSKKTWSVIDPIVGLLLGLVLESIAVGIWSAISHQKVGLRSTLPLGEEFFGFLGFWASLLGACYFASKIRGSSRFFKDYGLNSFRFLDLPKGVIFGVTAQFLLGWLIYLPFTTFIPSIKNDLSTPAKQLIGSPHGLGVVFSGFLLVVGAPIVEELFFRGLVLNSLISTFRKKFDEGRADVLAVIITAVVFGVSHGELLQLPGLILLGILLGTLKLRSKRLSISIITHASFNLVAFLSIWYGHSY